VRRGGPFLLIVCCAFAGLRLVAYVSFHRQRTSVAQACAVPSSEEAGPDWRMKAQKVRARLSHPNKKSAKKL
jgi:hypothetical protein